MYSEERTGASFASLVCRHVRRTVNVLSCFSGDYAPASPSVSPGFPYMTRPTATATDQYAHCYQDQSQPDISLLSG